MENQSREAVTGRETWHKPFAVLIGPTWQVGSDANVECPMRLVGHEIHKTLTRHAVAPIHHASKRTPLAGTSPAVTGGGAFAAALWAMLIFRA